jgi:2-polyprenyl-6-hydroxyphenyl methylase/3-demethylubiquinone-9 3-methyltransferase
MIFQGIEIDESKLSHDEIVEICRLLSSCHHQPPTLEEIWLIMDKVWHEIGCNQSDPFDGKLEQYYKHPVWVLNSLFSEQDPSSQINRQEIVDWIVSKQDISNVLDFGGGMGSLARALAIALPNLDIKIYEPSPHPFALGLTQSHHNIRYTKTIESEYDCIICLDVMEHLLSPLKTLKQLVESTKADGYLI